MEPIAVEAKSSEHILLHRCQLCGFERRQRCAKEDDFEAILRVVKGAVHFVRR